MKPQETKFTFVYNEIKQSILEGHTGSLLYLRAGTEWFYHGRRNLKPCNGNRPGRWKSDFTGNQSGTE